MGASYNTLKLCQTQVLPKEFTLTSKGEKEYKLDIKPLILSDVVLCFYNYNEVKGGDYMTVSWCKDAFTTEIIQTLEFDVLNLLEGKSLTPIADYNFSNGFIYVLIPKDILTSLNITKSLYMDCEIEISFPSIIMSEVACLTSVVKRVKLGKEYSSELF
jgi:hypothetical protein